jgi:hypothetical protein
MKNIDWKDVLERSAKTFVQAAVTCLLMQMKGVDLFAPDRSDKLWLSLLLSTIAAGLSAVWNIVLSPLIDAAKPTPEPKPPAEEEKPGDDESANG